MPHPPFIMLDENSGVPLYQQIYEAIRRLILSGEFAAGESLPASRPLAKELNVSRMTVINAYDLLFAEGYLESKIGSGIFVARHLPEEFLQTPDIEKQYESQTADFPRNIKLSEYGKNVWQNKRKVLINTQVTESVPFQPGLAAINEFPFDIWARLTGKCYRTLVRDVFGYGEPAGFYPLREAIADYLKSARAVNCTPEQVIITSGAQQAFNLIGKILFEPETEILIEDPCYFGARQAFQSFGAKLIPVPVDKNGFDLPATAVENMAARLAYVTPSHQFPLGVTMSLTRRRRLLDWAKKTESWIIEDDYDSEFRYEGRPIASLQGLDQDGRVLYIGTFSKTIFPGLRLGCIVVPKDLIEVFTAVRVLSGSQSSLIDQATLAEFINEGHFGRHIRRMRRLYEERKDILIAEVKKHLADSFEIKKTISGMHVIAWLKKDIKDTIVARKAIQMGLKVVAVSSQSLTKQERGGLILGYTAINETQIKQGVQQLVKVMNSV